VAAAFFIAIFKDKNVNLHFFHSITLFLFALFESSPAQFFRWSIEKLQIKVDNFMRRFTIVYHIEKRREAELRAEAAAEAARKLAAQLELKRQEAEAEAKKTEARFGRMGIEPLPPNNSENISHNMSCSTESNKTNCEQFFRYISIHMWKTSSQPLFFPSSACP
jgi:hypothetical protein